VQYLQKNTVKIDVYISKNNSAIHLGHAEVFLRDLIERETPLQDANTFKTPVITKPIRIFAARHTHTNTEQHLGMLKLKMRLRRPVGEAVRYFREKNEIETLRAMDLARTAGTTMSMH
jgi:ligand-binding SRPBCC domain-containing protein